MRVACDAFRKFAMCLALIVCLPLGAVAGASGKPIRIGASYTAILVWIADEQGFFRDEGLPVEVIPFGSGNAATEAVVNGEAELSTASETAFVSRVFEKPSLRVLATISASEATRIIGRSDRGIMQAADLAGKRVGVTLGTTGEYFLSRYMTLNGVPADKVTMVDLTPDEIVKQLVGGGIDAGATWEPHLSQVEKGLQEGAVILPQQLDQIYYFLLLTTAAWLEANPQAIRPMMRALITAERFAASRPEDAKALIRRRFQLSEEYINHIWPLHSLYVSLPQGLLFILEQQGEWYVDKGLTTAKTVPNYLDLIAVDALRDVRESSVGVVK